MSFEYDILGRRISKGTTEKQISYIYSNNDMVQEIETLSGSIVTKDYINGLWVDDIISYTLSGDMYYYHKNHLGSVIALSDDTGEVVMKYDYDVFGKTYVETLSGSIAIENYEGNDYSNYRLFTGREWDEEVGLYYYRARFYDSEIGRFISRDPIGVKDDVNLYAYVGNSPVIFVDAMGLEKMILVINFTTNRFGTNYSWGPVWRAKKFRDIKKVSYESAYSPKELKKILEKYKDKKVVELMVISHGSEYWLEFGPGKANFYNNHTKDKYWKNSSDYGDGLVKQTIEEDWKKLKSYKELRTITLLACRTWRNPSSEDTDYKSYASYLASFLNEDSKTEIWVWAPNNSYISIIDLVINWGKFIYFNGKDDNEKYKILFCSTYIYSTIYFS